MTVEVGGAHARGGAHAHDGVVRRGALGHAPQIPHQPGAVELRLEMAVPIITLVGDRDIVLVQKYSASKA